MIRRERPKRPEHIYPPDAWRMVEKQFYPRFLAVTETFFSTGNGYLGMRGNFEEGEPVAQNGTFINGFYETWPIVYGEEAYGFAKTGQTMVNITDSKIIKLYVDDEPFVLSTANLRNFERVLDMRSGTLNRDILWETPSGKQVSIKSQRLVSFEHRHLAAISYEVTVLNADTPVVISSEMSLPQQQHKKAEDDPRLARGFQRRILFPQIGYMKDQRIVLSHATQSSQMPLACGIDHTLKTACDYSYAGKQSEDAGKIVFSVEAKKGQPIQLTKYMTYHTAAAGSTSMAEELCERAERTLDRAKNNGFEQLLAEQTQYMDSFWERSDVQLTTDPSVAQRTTLAMQQALRFNLWQLLQASARADGAGVAAKGMTGLGYEGHYFWDTEIYVLPFLIYTSPRMARNLLEFRYSLLDMARKRASEVNQKGALFPWRTINGEEASAFFEAGTAQYHINADIMYGLKKYVDVTGDKDFLYHFGAEMLIETARLWADMGCYQEEDGKFHIHGVTGPDEYTTVVNNNTYTNMMARLNLHYAASTLKAMQAERPERYSALVHETGLQPGEIEAWQQAADNMYLPFDERRGIHPQDDSFLQKKRWDFDHIPTDQYPLLLHFHPLVIYRHQVIKQADMVLAMFLLGNEFSLEQKKRNFDYYDPLTTGDSSLSMCIQSIVAAEIGYQDLASEYSNYATLMDLEDIAGNSKDGCHIASMGGTWMVSVYGFAGMRDFDGQWSFSPHLPKALARLRFYLTIRGQLLEVDIGQKEMTYKLLQGSNLTITHRGQEVKLSANTPVTVAS
jgi:alpha,alpha-trehalose phosphorylase